MKICFNLGVTAPFVLPVLPALPRGNAPVSSSGLQTNMSGVDSFVRFGTSEEEALLESAREYHVPCAYCGEDMIFTRGDAARKASIEHIVPQVAAKKPKNKKHQGRLDCLPDPKLYDSPFNYLVTCRECNNHRGDEPLNEHFGPSNKTVFHSLKTYCEQLQNVQFWLPLKKSIPVKEEVIVGVNATKTNRKVCIRYTKAIMPALASEFDMTVPQLEAKLQAA